MERLTKRLEDGQAVMDCAACGVSWHKKREKDIPYCTTLFCRNRLKERLADYEDTGLEPEEIERIVDAYGRGHTLRTESAERLEVVREIKTDRLRELVQAEQDGRLVVLPCGTDAKLIRDGYTFKADHWSHLLTAFRDAPENKSGKQIGLFSMPEAEEALSKANTIPCKHGLSRHRNEIGEDEVYCELNAKWMNVNLGDCLGNCESEAALAGKGGDA